MILPSFTITYNIGHMTAIQSHDTLSNTVNKTTYLSWRHERHELTLLFTSKLHLKPKDNRSIFSFISPRTSSGTALMLVNPFLNTTNTRLAPHRSADVAQSNAVSPAPNTITVPLRLGRGVVLQEHIPGNVKNNKHHPVVSMANNLAC